MGSHKNRDNKGNARMQGHDVLQQMYRDGRDRSKHEDKKTGENNNYIYSDETLKAYHHNWDHFMDYVITQKQLDGEKIPRTLVGLDKYIQPYIDYLQTQHGKCGRGHMSAWTIRAYVSAACKVLGVSQSDYDLPERKTDDIFRSRGSSDMEKGHVNVNKNADVLMFARCLGLRNDKELIHCKGTDYFEKDGKAFVHIKKGKGGKVRDVEICGTPGEKEQIKNMMFNAGDNILFPHVNSHIDIHRRRAEYASAMYREYARPIDEIPPEDRYYPRTETHRGQVYDRQALDIVSQALGHGREDVLLQSYLWPLVSNNSNT